MELLLLLLFAFPARAADWLIENASKQKWFEAMQPDHLEVNVLNRPCAAFGGDQLYYSERDTSGIWQVQTVDPSRGVGGDASLELLNGRYPRIAYSDRSRASLKYASWEQDIEGVWRWHIEMVDYSTPSGSQSSLALGGDGMPHIAYRKNNGLTYTHRTATGWTTPVAVDPPGTLSDHYSLVVDPSDHPHILSSIAPGTLRYSYHDGAAWHHAALSDRFEGTTAPDLRITTNFLHAAFFEASVPFSPARIRYVAFAVGTPSVLLVDETVYSVASPANASLSLAAPPADQPLVAYTLDGDTQVHFARRAGTHSWNPYTLLNGGLGPASKISVALNSLGRIFIHYLADSAGPEVVARDATNPNAWSAPNPYLAGGDASEFMDLAVLGDGTPMVAYRDSARRKMIALQRDPQSGWMPFASDSANDPGGWVSITPAREHPRELHLAYYVADSADLRYQRSRDGVPVSGPSLPDSVGEVGSHASLAVHPLSGDPAIAYYDATNRHLKYASLAGVPGGVRFWATQTIDTADMTGEYAALAFDSVGHPFVGYRRASSGDVRVVSNLGSGWGAPEIVLTNLTPEHIAITFDPADHPHLSFIDTAGDGTLWYAWRGPSGWNWQAVDIGPNATPDGHTAIVLNDEGRPSILYHEGVSTNIVIATRRADGITWDLDEFAHFIGYGGDATKAGTLIRGPNGNPMACYYDSLEHDVMFAWQPEIKITGIERIPPNQVQLIWTPQIGGAWIERSMNLGSGSWTRFTDPLESSQLTFTENAARMFYRIVFEPTGSL